MTRATLGLLLLGACGGPPEAAVATTASATLGTDQAAGRSLRRMDIDQLTASIGQVSGGIGWTETSEVEDDSGVVRTEEVDLFEHLSLTLGKPDYLDSTNEDLTAGLLFQKFLDDASKSVCTRWIEAEVDRAASERVLLIYVEPTTTSRSDADAIRQNMSAALLRFHGRQIDTDDPRIDPWIGLFDNVHALTGDPLESWRAVCIALFTHPDFYSY